MRDTGGLTLSGRAAGEFAFQEAELLPGPFPITSETITDGGFSAATSAVFTLWISGSLCRQLIGRVCDLFSCKCETLLTQIKGEGSGWEKSPVPSAHRGGRGVHEPPREEVGPRRQQKLTQTISAMTLPSHRLVVKTRDVPIQHFELPK